MSPRRSRMGQEGSRELIDESIPARRLRSCTLEAVAELIKDGGAPRIVVLTGAGVSTSAGIPDFRSPKTGLYANLARLNLPYPEAVFDISYFREHPEPFWLLARELYPGKFKPTVAHAFISLLARKGLLHMLFTQNIDCLERAAGVPEEKIVEAHGSFASQRCIECRAVFPDDLMLSAVESGDVAHCVKKRCNGLVKPNVVFFGEALPQRFFQNVPKIRQANLLIVMGTSLTVHPFASLPEYVPLGVPRVLINLERVGGLGSRVDDVCHLADCDKGVRSLADALEWREELEALWREVSGKEAAADVVESAPDTRTKDEKLEDEIQALTRAVDDHLKLSDAHTLLLEDDLSAKIANRPSEEFANSAPGGEDNQAEAGGRPTIADDTDLESVNEPSKNDSENTKTLEEASISTPAKIAMESNPIGTEESTTESEPQLIADDTVQVD